MPQTQKTTTPYVHTFPNGSVAVVLDVPTDCSEGEEEAFRAFSPEWRNAFTIFSMPSRPNSPPWVRWWWSGSRRGRKGRWNTQPR